MSTDAPPTSNNPNRGNTSVSEVADEDTATYKVSHGKVHDPSVITEVAAVESSDGLLVLLNKQADPVFVCPTDQLNYLIQEDDEE